jgi:hypothetical protein
MDKYHTTEYKSKGCTVRIHRPILTKEERERREKEIKLALVQFAKETRLNK